jgi:hypothetical protein
MFIIGGIFWVLALGLFLASDTALLYLFMGTAAFGALNTLPVAVNLLPQTAAAVLLAVRVLWRRDNRRLAFAALISWRGFALLAGFVLWGAVSGLTLPSIFQGRIDVIGMEAPVRQKLEPSIANINQSAYLILDLISALTLFAYLKSDRKGEAREHLMRALALSGILFVASGLLEYSTLAPDLVASFKTASYSMVADAEVARVRRIAGFFSEASAYGPKCVALGALLFFARAACRSQLWRQWVLPGISLVLVVMGAMSTSSTAYIALFVFLALLGVRVGLRMYRRSPAAEYALELGVMGFGVMVLSLAWAIQPDLLNVPMNVLNAMVFKKAESTSFFERSFWNHTGKMAFYETWGLGAGAGSARTSNWAISILANTGVLGAILMSGYLAVTFFQASSQKSNRWGSVSRGGKYSLIVVLAALVASGTTIDPGLNFVVAAVAVAAGSQWSDALSASTRSRKKSRSSSRSSRSSKSRRSRRRSRPEDQAEPQPA